MFKIKILLFCTLCAYAAKASLLKPDIGVGLKSGVNFNAVNAVGFKNNLNTNLLLSVYSYVNTKKWGLQYEVILSSAHATTDTSFKTLYKQYLQNALDSVRQGSFSIPQLQVPLIFNYKLKKRIWLQGGVMYTSNICVIDKNSFVQSNINVFKANDASLLLGVWFRLPLKINASIRAVKGLTNLNYLTSNNAWVNNTIQVSLGYGMQ